ncbi:voltage-gated chloride channel family protein [Flavobacterium silvaticum]|uniref:Voltage-gated chloride channel family protein n=1 Tax=Flavobacterium silvaticum TaxID=1852020 RepID=A0A972FR02_9FLAO|nr:voltage-gated chloride channel family protein [Flavobacterium silvaticum]NMH26888.1 voltage-gated chloride channel family protein [Flavobacterium silvaticum]
MTKRNFNIARIPQTNYLIYLAKWLALSTVIGICIGSVTAFFLLSLDCVTHWRENHLWIIAFLPLGGLSIGLSYHYLGASVVRGNNLLLEEFHNPKQIIPFKMAPLVLFGTLATHLFGGSAGREGTAVQMGGAIADQFTRFFKMEHSDRKILLVMGISAGFAAVFGTPLAGAVFALEVFAIGGIFYQAIVPALLAAIIADHVCLAWQVQHTTYAITTIPEMSGMNLIWTLGLGIGFGLTALFFSKTVHFFGHLFRKRIAYPPLRPFIGGVVIAFSVWTMDTTDYIGLGIPMISESFLQQMPWYAFALKLLLTTFTLGAGFKGGEVTPLFFIGATLGSACFGFVPLPVALLAGMGFVAVFSGATNTPIACTLMGMELFGSACGIYIGLACVLAYLFSGHTGIYSSQIIGNPKHLFYARFQGKQLEDLQNKDH